MPREINSLAAAAFDGLTTSILIVDRSLRLMAMNPAAESLFGVSAKQTLGTRVGVEFPGFDVLERLLSRVHASGDSTVERDLRIAPPGQGEFNVDCIVTPLGFSADQATGTMLVELVLIDRLKQINRGENLLAQNESVRFVLRGLAHEIRNPLGGLRGAAQLLERELHDQHLTEYTQVIIHEADRLRRLLDRLLGPRTPPAIRPVNLHKVTERVHALVQAESPDGIVIERDYDPSIPELQADPELLIQALLNVMRNAVQALRGRGEICLRTRIHRQFNIGAHRHKLVARIDVTDNGPGVPEDIRDRIFFPLVTGTSTGSGLGLSIAQSALHSHGGLIECVSAADRTTFSLFIPVNRHQATGANG